MKRSGALCTAILCCGLAYAETSAPGDSLKSPQYSAKHGLGFVMGLTSGYGLSYKRVLTPAMAFQVTAAAHGNSDTYITMIAGANFQKKFFESGKTCLVFAPGFSWKQQFDMNTEDDLAAEPQYYSYPYTYPTDSLYYLRKYDRKMFTAGATVGMEYRLSRIGIGFFAGYRGVVDWRYKNVNYHASMMEYDYRGGNYSSRSEATSQDLQRYYEVGFSGDISLLYYF